MNKYNKYLQNLTSKLNFEGWVGLDSPNLTWMLILRPIFNTKTARIPFVVCASSYLKRSRKRPCIRDR